MRNSTILLLFTLLLAAGRATAEEAWEYAPYKVCVWFALDPSLDTSDQAGGELIERTRHRLESTFGPAWQLVSAVVPPNLQGLIQRGPQSLIVEHLSASDLVLVLAKDDPTTKTLRVLETTLEQVDKIALTRSDADQLEIDSQPLAQTDALVQILLKKANEEFESYDDLAVALKEKKVPAALIPRSQLPAFSDVARPVTTSLPWHTERTLHDFDKLFIVHCWRSGENYRVAVRELDCPMRLFGPTIEGSTVAWQNVAELTTDCFVSAFAPVARIEEASGRTARLLTRAGGLISGANPARIQPGDVLQPVIRRDDRRGVTTLLEPIPWTFIAVTGGATAHVEGTVYSALGNVLQGKQTRRAQRVALRVRPTGDHSDIKIVTRTNLAQPQPGCQVYERDLLTEELRLVGHTDWRGIITIESPHSPGAILPESERIKRAEARRMAAEIAAEAAAEKAAATTAAQKAAPPKPADAGESDVRAADAGDKRGSTSGQSGSPSKLVEGMELPVPQIPGSGSTPPPATTLGEDDLPDVRTVAVPLRQPLMLFYIKSGDLVLARLPLVPGLHAEDVADLPSDARRLEAEAILRGFQGDIVDLIGKRALAAARVKQYLADKRFDEAEEVIGEVRRLRDYKSMADTLDGIQRRLLDESKESIPMAAKSRIDRMTQTTRDMLQKYLENDLVLKLDRDLKHAQAAALEEEKAAAAKAAEEAAKAAEGTSKRDAAR